MIFQEFETDGTLSFDVLKNRRERSRIQVQLVLIHSLTLALDAQVNFEIKEISETSDSFHPDLESRL
jgi:hypothetical protein